MKTLEKKSFLRKYKNKWVALTDDDKIVCSGSSLENVLRRAKAKGIDDPVTAKIPDPKFEFVL
jgi:hypothetical protein